MTFQAVKCPDCGFLFTPTPDGLVPVHGSPGPLPWQVGCPGTGKKPAEAELTETADCGCTVMKGWRCQFHGAP